MDIFTDQDQEATYQALEEEAKPIRFFYESPYKFHSNEPDGYLDDPQGELVGLVESGEIDLTPEEKREFEYWYGDLLEWFNKAVADSEQLLQEEVAAVFPLGSGFEGKETDSTPPMKYSRRATPQEQEEFDNICAVHCSGPLPGEQPEVPECLKKYLA